MGEKNISILWGLKEEIPVWVSEKGEVRRLEDPQGLERAFAECKGPTVAVLPAGEKAVEGAIKGLAEWPFRRPYLVFVGERVPGWLEGFLRNALGVAILKEKEELEKFLEELICNNLPKELIPPYEKLEISTFLLESDEIYYEIFKAYFANQEFAEELRQKNFPFLKEITFRFKGKLVNPEEVKEENFVEEIEKEILEGKFQVVFFDLGLTKEEIEEIGRVQKNFTLEELKRVSTGIRLALRLAERWREGKGGVLPMIHTQFRGLSNELVRALKKEGLSVWVSKPLLPESAERIFNFLVQSRWYHLQMAYPWQGFFQVKEEELRSRIFAQEIPTLEEMERELVRRALEECTTLTEAAKKLGISEATLRRLRKRYDLVEKR